MMDNNIGAPVPRVCAGLRQGDVRVTCVLTEEQAQILRDFAKTAGVTFREVCQSMASKYIDVVVRPQCAKGLRLRRPLIPEDDQYRAAVMRQILEENCYLYADVRKNPEV